MKNKAAFKEAARDLAQDCIVTQALGRFLEQILEEVYETCIKTLEQENARLRVTLTDHTLAGEGR